MVKPVCLIWGDSDQASWHPLPRVLPLLESMLGQDFSIRVRDDGFLDASDLQDTALVLNYRDQWESTPDPAQAVLLERFILAGGSLLSLHNGICLAREPRFLPFLGGIFTGHPEPASLEFTHGPLESGESRAEPCGCEPDTPSAIPASFTLTEEPYRFDFPPDCQARIFLRYQYGGMSCPAGWTMPQADSSTGRSVYLAPGHDAAIFGNASYAGLIRTCALWCISSKTT